ncbi:mlo protein [Dioscorea alata]|uniref:Mlo protein n=1 Tax=Dioscorea alata TaxID=55571 RepID=A0ACB7W155_DIOAL|nr:mlo protein [Dioscorea alata]
MAGGESEGLSLQYTPTWIVALVCSVIVIISLFVERLLHYLGKFLKKKNQKPLFDALLKVKEELMLLGFISLLLVVFQGTLQKICVSGDILKHMLPCKRNTETVTEHFVVGGRRRLLSSGGADSDYCVKKGKFPLLSVEAIHDLHIFIFVLAIAHVVFSVVTMLLGSLKIREWKKWEDSIQRNNTVSSGQGITHVHQLEFVRKRFRRFGVDWPILTWVHSFFKQFFGSLTKSDYETMRLGFIMTHCRGNPKFNFHKYMVRALEADFKKVVGISWYLWIFVVVFMLLDVHGWHAYFWLSFVPLIVLLAVGTKLEQVISQLAQEVAEKHSAIEGDLVVSPSDDHFWFHRPQIILFLIHFILFQNAFEVAFFFWILTTFSINSCIMGSIGYVIPRLVIVVFVQLVCSYSTLPLYAIVSHMGTSFKKSIFDENVQEGLAGWAKKAKKKKGHSTENTVSNRAGSTINGSPTSVMLHNMVSHHDPSFMEEGRQLEEEQRA